jgi:hypothetical protein
MINRVVLGSRGTSKAEEKRLTRKKLPKYDPKAFGKMASKSKGEGIGVIIVIVTSFLHL